MSETVEVCPDCGSHCFNTNSNDPFRGSNAGSQYTCGECSHKFDQPAVRERQSHEGLSGTVATLDDANAEEVLGE